MRARKSIIFTSNGAPPFANSNAERAVISKSCVGEKPHAATGHQDLVLGVRDVIADVVVEQIVADDTDGDFADAAIRRLRWASIV